MKKSLTALSLPLAAIGIVSAGALFGFTRHEAASTIPASAATATVSAAADAWTVDPVHSTMVFRIKHNGASWFYGRFNEISGSVAIDAADAGKSAVNIDIKTASVDTANAARDKHLRSGDFFNADQFPTCSFKSKSVAASGAAFDVTGDLTINGVTKEIKVKLEKTGEGESRGAKLMGFETQFDINRQDYGIKYGSGGGLGDDVRITVSLETKK